VNNPPNFEEIVKQVTNALPKGITDLQQDLEKNVRTAMESTFRRMNLVTREEFDVQAAVLQRTRERLEMLEEKVAALESKNLP